MIRTFVDSGVLITAARGVEVLATQALTLLSDPDRLFLSSRYVQLEVLPKPLYNKHVSEAHFYQTFFDAVTVWLETDIVSSAFMYAQRYGLSALDALYVAAAITLQADELVTTEGAGKPLHRVTEIRIVGLFS